jgi:hypothetical protein
MLRTLSAVGLALLCSALPGPALQAQTDYRNLDDERPTVTEDAYPIEHRAFELMAPFTVERHHGRDVFEVSPEVVWGALGNMMVGAKFPFIVERDERAEGMRLAGPRLFALANLNTESPWLPALAIRGDVAVPGGASSGDGTLFTLKGIATRSWGTWRMHVNGARTFGSAEDAPAAEAPARWSAKVAVDHTLWRHSMLIVGEVIAAEPLEVDRVEWRAGLGVRLQATPTLVIDAGGFRRLSREGVDLGVTLGFSHTFAIAALMPGGAR